MAEEGELVAIPVSVLEFCEGRNTIWVHGRGGTIMRIKTKGKITSKVCNTSPITHVDIVVDGDIEICLANESNGGD